MLMTHRSIRFIASVAGYLLLGCLQAACGQTAETRAWTSRDDQKTMQAEYLGLANGKVSLRLPNKTQTQVPLEKLSDDDQQYVKSRLGKLRDWTAAKSGKKATAQFVQLMDDGRVELLLGDLKPCWLPRAGLVAADQKYLDTEAPIPLLRRLPGIWTGHAYGESQRQVHRMEIRLVAGKLRAEHVIYEGLTDEELTAALRGSLKATQPLYVTAWAVKRESTITIDGGQMTFELSKAEPVFAAIKVPKFDKDKSPVFKIQGAYPKSGLITGDSIGLGPGNELKYFFTKVGSYDNLEPNDLARSEIHQMTSSLDSSFHYSLYIPKSYRSDQPAALLVNDSAGGNAEPLSLLAAEETGWICIGLTESSNDADVKTSGGNCVTAVLDVRRMLNIHPQRFYFCGLSGGARRAARRSLMYPSNTAGIICMAAGFSYWQTGELRGHFLMPPLKVAAFMIVGGPDDMNHSEVCDRLFPVLQQQKRACQLIVHPGGHDWGRPEDHLAAIRWLDQQWKTPSK